jgi:hypothetical protein
MLTVTVNNTFFFATIDKVFYYVASVLTTCFGVPSQKGRAIAQTVSRWLSTMEARFDTRSVHMELVVDNVTLG